MKLVVMAFVLLTGPLHAFEVQKPLTAAKSWIKAPGESAKSAVAFTVIDNPTMYDVYLVSATTEVAGSVQFVALAKDGSEPKPVEALSAPAYGSVELKADGTHLLLRDLKRPLEVGEKIAIYITTDGGASIEVAAEVRRN
jgi:copper(I)-binding protein